MKLRVSGLRRRFGAVVAVDDASFEIRGGEVLGLLGPNGAGKSTVLACLAGLLPADAGSVTRDGVPLGAADRRDALFYLPDGVAPWPDQRVEWVLDFGRALHGGAGWRGELESALGIASLRRRRLGALSKGQRKRVVLAHALGTPQPAGLLGEPVDRLA